MQEKIKKYFLTGLLTILPLWITIYILWLLFRLIAGFTYPLLSPIIHSTALFEKEQVTWLIRLISFFLTLIIIYLVGLTANNLLGRRILLTIERYLFQVPLIRDIYQAIRKFIQHLFIKRSAFRQVVLVEFPSSGIYSIGFITSENSEPGITSVLNKKLVNVFIPTTPNISTGFLVMIEPEKIIKLDISFDDALRLIISGGVLTQNNRSEEKT
jgi:uncharacterized membrane protein